MFEIYRMQLRQILGGRMKWLVVAILTMPVLLTLALVSVGGLEEIQREINGETERSQFMQDVLAGKVPDTARRVVWEGEDLRLANGFWSLREEGLFDLVGEPVGQDRGVIVGNGWLIYLRGQLWIDDSKEQPHGQFHVRSFPVGLTHESRAPVVPITMRTITAFYLFLLYPQAICLLISLFYGTSVLGHELSGKTVTYLFTRALPRWKFVLGKYLGIMAALVIPASLSLLASWSLLGAEGGLVTLGGLLAGTIGALIAYNALFILFGFLIPRRAMIAALLYGVIFELILSFIPALVNQFTITYYLRSLLVEMLDVQVPREVVRIVGGASPSAALIALAGMTIGALAVSSGLATHREYVVRDQA